MKQHSQNMISENPTPQKVSGRLLALDILRGITIAGMILVNNPGSWGHIYAPLAHAEWNGLTPTDLVFPFFMYIMGISTYFSLKKYDFTLSRTCLMKILRRTIVIFLIGIAIAWFGLLMRGILSDASFADAVFNTTGMGWGIWGFVITFGPLVVVGASARAKYKTNYLTIMGLFSGGYTDPPALAYANNSTANDAPAVAYSTVYPLTMFLRVVAAQALVLCLA